MSRFDDLRRLDERLRAAFPDRAARILAVLERTFWQPNLRDARSCSFCGRTRRDATIVACYAADERHPERRYVQLTQWAPYGPTLFVCHVCIATARVLLDDADAIPSRDALLADAVRALRAGGRTEDEPLLARLEQALLIPLATPEPAPCKVCNAGPERALHAGYGRGLCRACVDAAAVAPERPAPTSTRRV